ncbi:Ribonuclease h domain, partial [Thalictrum thalictroides]
MKEWAKANCSKLHEKVMLAFTQLEDLQKQIQRNPTNVQLCRLERKALRKYCNLAAAERNQVRQKAGCDWLSMGDRPSAFFHHAVKERKGRKAIRILEDNQGNKLNTEAAIVTEITSYFRNLFGEDDLE